jgi:nucleotidyltransferase/DNA polymerase involved in DNA repair
MPSAFAAAAAGALLLQEPEGAEAVQAWWLRPASSWSPTDALLAAGAVVVAQARAAVKASLGFSCSAGIAHSKILAKLGSGLHKPAQQTLVPGKPGDDAVPVPLELFWGSPLNVFWESVALSCSACRCSLLC